MRIKNAFLASYALSVAFAATISAAFANPDAGLYDPVPPEGSAFVRFANDYEDMGSEKAMANNKIFDYLDYKELSSYFVVPEGEVKAEIGSRSKKFDAQAGNFYTVVLGESNELIITEDKKNENRAKAQIGFYNFTGQDGLSVRTSDGKVEIVPPVADDKSGEREINPVKVSLGVFNGTELVKDLGMVSLDRSNSYSIIAYSGDDIQWMQSTTNTTR